MDYRKLNDITIKDDYPLPDLQHELDKLQGKTLFTKVNLCSGYNNIHLEPKDTWEASFKTPLVSQLVFAMGRCNPLGMWVGVHVGMGLGPSLHTPHMTHTCRCPTLTCQSGYAGIGSVAACSIALAVEKLYSTYIVDTVYRLCGIVILSRALAIMAHNVVDPNLILNEPHK